MSVRANNELNEALALLTQGEVDAAFKRLQALAADAGASWVVHYNFGRLLHDLGRHREAARHYEAVTRCAPEQLAAWTNLVDVWSELGELDAALACVNRALLLAPNAADNHCNRGNVLHRLLQTDEAIASFRRALQCSPTHHVAMRHLALALAHAGESDRARDAAEQALTLAPHAFDALAIVAELLLAAGDSQRVLDRCLAFKGASVSGARAYALLARAQQGVREAGLAYADLLRATQYARGPAGRPIAELNAALEAELLDQPSLTLSPARHATRGGLHSGALQWLAGPAMQEWRRLAEQAVRGYLQRPPAVLGAPPRQVRLHVWAVVLDAGGHQTGHIHPDAYLSGVYYVRAPAPAHPGTRDGRLAFGLLPDALQGRVDAGEWTVRPEAGLMVLFPSHCFHGTVPFRGEGRRISIAFDVLAA